MDETHLFKVTITFEYKGATSHVFIRNRTSVQAIWHALNQYVTTNTGNITVKCELC